MEKFVRASAEHLAFTAKFLHLDFKHHAGVVVEATSDRQVHRHGRRGRCKGRKGHEGGFELVECIHGHTVHAGQKFTSRPERFHATVQRSQRLEGFGIGRVETVGGEQVSQTGVVTLIEQAHGAGNRWFTGGLVNLAESRVRSRRP